MDATGKRVARSTTRRMPDSCLHIALSFTHRIA
jgi:hypothetical protein